MAVRKIISLILLNGILAAVLVLCYSPGYLCLRPGDTSIIRAGLSILIPVFSAAAFIGGNMRILKEKTYKEAEKISDTGTANKILEQYTKSRLFGKTASSALSQLSRLGSLQEGLPGVVEECFEAGSMSHAKYMAAVNGACSALFANIEVMAKHINHFDEKGYWYLIKNYKNDDIPDEIQEEQIRQYEDEITFIKGRLSDNEKVLVKLGELKNSLLSMGHGDQGKKQEALLYDVQKMTEDLQYYKG